MVKVGVVLSGCGVFDGSEIHESVLTLLSLDQQGAEAVCMAPDIEQMHVINHMSGREMEGERRNVLVESARIARGAVTDVAAVGAADLDALIFPGGYGAAKNLCDFAIKGPESSLNPEVERLVREMRTAGKPTAFLCISPVIAAKVLGGEGVELTIGNDPDTVEGIRACGGVHVEKSVTEIHEDTVRRVVSTPAYMLGQRVSEVAEGIDKAVRALLSMV